MRVERASRSAIAAATLIVCFTWTPGASAEAGCEAPPDFEPRGRIELDGVVVLYRTQPALIEIGQHFAVEAIVCAPNASALTVDAVMPNHRHGMNYRPRVSAHGNGRYVVDGLLFHMPGKWRLLFDVRSGAATHRLWQDIELE
jgi:hypothetical protein